MDQSQISASLGAMSSLAGKLDALLDTELKVEIEKLKTWLVMLSKARDPPVTAKIWMKDVRELSYDMENCVDVAEPDWIFRMSGFKARVKDANERYERYTLGNTDDAPDCQIPLMEGQIRRDIAVVGLHDGPFHSLCNLLTDGDEQLKVLSIVGVGGIGKTTLATQLWRDKKLGDYFHCRAFVRTAKKADMRRILRSILAQVRPHQPPDTNEVHELIHDLRDHLRNKRYFLIIDDLWATSVWDVARRAFPEGNGSRIITTTEVETVALACCSYQSKHIFKMEPFSLSHSRELFTSGMFGSGGEKSHQLDEVIAEILERCGGLPLAIISISSVIASLGEANTVQSWEKIQNNLSTNTAPDNMLKQVLNFCFNCLPSGLQTCLLYLSLYPENYLILMEDIVKQWVAEGFILAPTEKEKMEVAGKYFDKLVDMGMIQHINVDYCDDVLYYAVHHMVHDFITSKSIEENFVTAIDYSQRTVRFSNKVCRLSLQFGSATYATTPSSIGLSQVRSLCFIGLKSCLPPISEFKLLRFLTLHMWADQPSTGIDLKPTSELVLLRSLQVTCNDTVHLPQLMQGPIHLETLQINARVADIPANIIHLRSWLHLRLGIGTELPDVTGILKNVALNPPISLDESSSPPDSVTTLDLLSPISRIPKWVGQLTNLCILRFVLRELQMDGIINLQGLPFLAVLSLRVQRRTRELIGFANGAFAALEYFEFRCGVLCLAFEEGAMPNLQRVKLGFNAHRGEQYERLLVGIEDLPSVQKISGIIGAAMGADKYDLDSAKSAFKKAMGKHSSKVSINRVDMVEEEFDPPEVSINRREQHPTTSSEHPGSQKQESHEEFDPPEQQRSIRGQHPSASSEQQEVPRQDSEIQITEDFGSYSQSIKRLPSMMYLSVGLAKLAVEGAFSKVNAAIQEEAKIPLTAQRDLQFIKSELEMMHSSLDHTKVEHLENQTVSTWVTQLRELAYDVEDCVELVVHLDKDKTRFWFRVRPLCLPWTPARMPALDEIKQLKARVEDVSNRNARYNFISDTGSKPATVEELLPAAAGRRMVAASNMLIEAREAARRAQILDGGALTQLITKKVEDDLQVISLWGSGSNHGTADILRKTYNDPEICRNFTCRAWVKLTHTPLSPHELVQRCMLQLCAAKQQEGAANMGMDVLTQENLFKDFERIVTEKRLLIVLEGLSNMEEWHALRKFFPDRRKGSCIIVSTQQPEVASLCVGHSYQILELKQFSREHSICALFMKGSQDYRDKYEKLALSQVAQNSSYGKNPSSNMEGAAYWMENYPLVGRDSEMNELRSYTTRALLRNSRVISVCGIAGIGKSALVRNFYYDRMIHTNQFNEYRWVDVSHPFNLRDFCSSLLLDHHSEKDPIKECNELMSQHQCLVVIDDIQSKKEWDLIRSAFVSRPSASVIIVVTTEPNIATYCTNDEQQVFEVNALASAAGMDLFRKEVHRKEPSSPLNFLVCLELDELILKCGGLPKVIVALAASLATKTVTLMDDVCSLNQRFMHHLETNQEYNSLRGLFSWIHAYFHDCSDSLKPFILYLLIFPRDCNIRRRRLVRRWIAEGYSRDSDEKSAEEQGEEFFSKLLGLSIIQKIHRLGTTAFIGARIASCQVNGFIGEYIISRRMEENLVLELGPNFVRTNKRTGRHLSILSDWDRDQVVFESIDFSKLRSMTVFGKWESFFISKSMRLLRVLDLEETLGVKDEDLKKMVQLLRRLKFLSLRGCSEIFHLPSSLADLRQLQTLDVRHTSIVTLPASITKLQKLQYIRAGTTIPPSTMSVPSNKLRIFRRHRSLVGVDVPRGIGKLTALHTLGVVNVGASGGKAVVEELKKLTQLRKIGVSGINRHNSNDFISATSGHVYLESLLVRLDKDSKGCLDDISLPWQNLQSLKMYGLEDKLPLSSSHLNKLRKLDLEMATLGQGDIEFLAKLPNLCILGLRVKQLQDGKLHLYAEMYGEQILTFENVTILEIACSSSQVLHVVFGSKSMKNLELLKIDCSVASCQLTGLDYLSELKQVLLKGGDDEIKEALENQLLDSHAKTPPAVKLEELPRSSRRNYH